MPDYVLPDRLARELKELRKRVEALERSPRLGNSSMAGTLRVADAAGNTVARIGELDDGTTGLATYDSDGQVILEANRTNGLISPWVGYSWININAPVVITSGTAVGAYISYIDLLWGRQFQFRFLVGTDSATTGELSVQLNGGNIGTTQATDAGTLSLYEFSYEHGEALGTGPHSVALLARRTSGSGNINVYSPGALTVGANMPVAAGGWH